jgi:predicted DNA-binding transcriptional regulator AlpA
MENQSNQTFQSPFLSISNVVQITSFSKVWIYRKIKEGSFPRQVTIGGEGCSVRWLRVEVFEWVRKNGGAK